MMDEHGGTVRLLRRKGGGTTVELGFPLTDPAIEATKPTTKPVAAKTVKTAAKKPAEEQEIKPHEPNDSGTADG
ncbi:MAG: hypothetical protein EON60_12015 [Alphaproteobacteria bacterium]|nr:MAG: hypothetical protein EON60_12015 [Alphaproteobacteria bacterium]